MQFRRRIKQTFSLNDRLKLFSDQLKAQASRLRQASEQDVLRKKAGSAELASQVEAWVNSPGLQPPKDPRRS
jgi:hypothetical protein